MESADDGGFSVGGSLGEDNYFLGYTFTDRSHSSRVVKSIMDLSLEDGLFADVTVTVDSKEFHLHRLVLSAQSTFFRSMFTSNLKESHDRNIELKDVSASVFQLLIGYIYHGTIKLSVDELQDTYEMADMYQLTSLFEECSRFLSRTVEVKNCLQVMWLADRHSDQELYTAAKQCAKIHLAQLYQTDEYLNLPFRLLLDILKDGVPSSQNPTAAIETWTNFNKVERERFSCILQENLKEIGENVHIYLIGKEEMRTHSLAVSLHCDEDDAISVSGQNSLCHQITAACKHGGDLYVVGGSIPRRMWKCNMHTMDWERCAPLPRDRLHHTMVSVASEDTIYSLGGKTLQDSLSNAVIYYTVKDNMWTETSQLDTAVSGAAGVNLGGTIYLLGGEENDMDFFTKPSRLIQCFDTSTQKCEIKPYLLPFAGFMHAAVHMDVIFIVAEGDSLICYNPLLESFTRLRFPEVWSCVPSLWKVASCNGCIYVFRDKCKKGDANTLKLNPATSVVSVIRGIKILLTNWQFVLA
ncbi:kelch repeat and BTB domain-containing protein 4 [Synchiropus splendidus]|uniref:kelch repeat and BTB domain-containing protein 4 n=1 Tax=Synchiropus splendidus TaxID=270530 RepID=UPI00237E677C|nr:kelch repeat and BTB domain-containing protein 4 [Synchiropus splendidus]XP_053741747.1 kelch repeat and BTB domain-containing protein 4 [Synchiropus splendidus]XP_053741748.1 kelch repeat and BTB domain-containing protein 4 [Synchiropus splendidus]XP_053741749.1 kelch repeat and BTB domain-containing protein 4 [Synchiropus splendidus]